MAVPSCERVKICRGAAGYITTELTVQYNGQVDWISVDIMHHC